MTQVELGESHKSLSSLFDRVYVYKGNLEDDASLFKTMKECYEILGSLSEPSKMPCYTYDLPASKCRTGSKLSKKPGTVCYGCYAADLVEWAKKTNRWTYYALPSAKGANAYRFEAIKHPLWVPAMVAVLRMKKARYFRWHSSGDIQSIYHLRNIVMVAEACPSIRFWIPTREYEIVDSYNRKYGDFPSNLAVRMSAHYIDEKPPSDCSLGSMVINNREAPKEAVRCKAYTRDNFCGGCRACWTKEIPLIAYGYH